MNSNESLAKSKKQQQKALYPVRPSGIIDIVENLVTTTNPSSSPIKHPVTQEQIDDILDNELKEYMFPVKPLYNSRIRANGITKGEIYKWGQLKRIVSIEIGKQDKPDREFLIDTLLHEYYEADIMKKQYDIEFYKNLYRAGDEKRHAWINSQISEFFEKWRSTHELGRY